MTTGRRIFTFRPSDIPVVTQEEFDAIQCNRCGICCTQLWQPGPLEIAALMGRMAHGEFSYPDNDKMIDWWSHLEPTGERSNWETGNTHQYSCDYFQPGADGLGRCTNYENRPHVCSNFPYGKPVMDIPECSWFVRMKEEE